MVSQPEGEGEPVVVESPDETFTTRAPGTTFVLPDGREWEMVSPPNKQGAKINPIGEEWGADIQAAVDGGAMTYTANGPFVADPAGSRTIEFTQVFSTRRAPGSWESADITTPDNEGATQVDSGTNS